MLLYGSVHGMSVHSDNTIHKMKVVERYQQQRRAR